MKIGIQFQTHGVNPGLFGQYVEQTLDLGVDAIFFWDHLVPFTGQRGDSSWDSWSLLGSVAGLFEGREADVGVLVAPLSYREPAVIARAAATLAQIGNGRFILGVGAGGFAFDDELVRSPETVGERTQNFAVGLAKTRAEIDRQNALYGTEISLWVGGMGEQVTIPLAREFADGWNGFGPPQEFASKLKILNQTNSNRTALVTSVLLTSRDRHNDVRSYVEMGASEVIRSLAPTSEGIFDLSLVEQLLAERENCR